MHWLTGEGQRQQSYSRSRKPWTLRRFRRTRSRRRRKRNGRGRGSPCSRTGRDWTMAQPGMRSYGKKGSPGWESRTTWDTTKKPMTQTVRPSREPLTRWQDAAWYRNGSPSSPTPKPPSGEWYQRTPAQARNTQSRQDSTSRRCVKPNRTLASSSGGARPTRASRATRKPTNGQSLRLEPRLRWVGGAHLDLSNTLRGRSRRRSGRKPDSGLEDGSPATSTRCRANSG